MAAKITFVPVMIGLLVTRLLLLSAAARAAVTIPGFPAVNGAAPPSAATVGGELPKPKLPFPFPGSMETPTMSGGLPKLPFPFPGSQAAPTKGGGLPRLPFPFPGSQAVPTSGGGLPHLPFLFPGSQEAPTTGAGLPKLPFPLPGGGAECMKAVHHAEGCVAVVFRSLASPGEDAIRAGADCCRALQAVGDRCFRDVVPVPSPFRALYAPLVKQACGLPSSFLRGPRV